MSIKKVCDVCDKDAGEYPDPLERGDCRGDVCGPCVRLARAYVQGIINADTTRAAARIMKVLFP